MKSIKEIKEQYSCQTIWAKLYDWCQKTGNELGAYGNGFDRVGKVYLDSIVNNYPEYEQEILNLF